MVSINLLRVGQESIAIGHFRDRRQKKKDAVGWTSLQQIPPQWTLAVISVSLESLSLT